VSVQARLIEGAGGEVLRAGRRLTVVRAEVPALLGPAHRSIAIL